MERRGTWRIRRRIIRIIRYDEEEKPEEADATQPGVTADAEPPADDEIKTVGGSKSVRYD